MSGEQLLAKIKSTGYWRVNIRPTVFDRSRLTQLSRCWDAVESSRVRLRGWDYPHIDPDYHPNMDRWVESGADFMDHVEYWRLYQSGQFIHYFAFFEDYREVPWWSSEYEGGRPEKYLEIINTLLRVTEIFEFAARLAEKGVLSPGAMISITLVGTEGRELVFWDGSRSLSLWRRYASNLPEVRFDRVYPEGDLLARAPEMALEAAIHIFERFNWNNPPRDVFAEDQRRLLERRM